MFDMFFKRNDDIMTLSKFRDVLEAQSDLSKPIVLSSARQPEYWHYTDDPTLIETNDAWSLKYGSGIIISLFQSSAGQSWTAGDIINFIDEVIQSNGDQYMCIQFASSDTHRGAGVAARVPVWDISLGDEFNSFICSGEIKDQDLYYKEDCQISTSMA